MNCIPTSVESSLAYTMVLNSNNKLMKWQVLFIFILLIKLRLRQVDQIDLSLTTSNIFYLQRWILWWHSPLKDLETIINPIAMSTLGVPMVFLTKTNKPKKQQVSLEKCPIPGWRKEKYKMNLEHLVISESLLKCVISQLERVFLTPPVD